MPCDEDVRGTIIGYCSHRPRRMFCSYFHQISGIWWLLSFQYVLDAPGGCCMLHDGAGLGSTGSGTGTFETRGTVKLASRYEP
jgi:hypothetical protein